MTLTISPQFIQQIRFMAESLPVYTGDDRPQNYYVISRCRWTHYRSGSMLIYTRDGMFHDSGWIKNPTFNQCYHLSLSFYDGAHAQRLPQNRKLADLWCKLLFGSAHLSKLLVESPKSDEGKALDVWHYRLFTDPHWQPIIPHGEPYHTLLTETGWRSWSERHERKPDLILPPGVEG